MEVCFQFQVGRQRNQGVVFSNSGVNIHLSTQAQASRTGGGKSYAGGLFASVNQAGKAFGITPNQPSSPDNAATTKILAANMQMKFMSMPDPALPVERGPELTIADIFEAEETVELSNNNNNNNKKKKMMMMMKTGFRWNIKVENPSLRRLISGGVAGAVSRTAVAPLETIRTHLMAGSCGHSAIEVFDDIVTSDGWKGLFRGNLVNVIRVAPSKAIELFAYDTAMKHSASEPGEWPKLPFPALSVAGAVAGVGSTLCAYPLELLKTQISVQRGVYENLLDAFLKILCEKVLENFTGALPQV